MAMRCYIFQDEPSTSAVRNSASLWTKSDFRLQREESFVALGQWDPAAGRWEGIVAAELKQLHVHVQTCRGSRRSHILALFARDVVGQDRPWSAAPSPYFRSIQTAKDSAEIRSLARLTPTVHKSKGPHGPMGGVLPGVPIALHLEESRWCICRALEEVGTVETMCNLSWQRTDHRSGLYGPCDAKLFTPLQATLGRVRRLQVSFRP